MKPPKFLIALFICWIINSTLLLSCKKETIDYSQRRVEYFVTTKVPDFAGISWADENEIPHQGFFETPWGYGFLTSNKPYTAIFSAYAYYSPGQELVLTIKVNGTIVKQKQIFADSTQGYLAGQLQFLIQ